MSIIEELKNQIAGLELQIKEIQESCSHPPLCLVIIHRAEDGYDYNYEWAEYECKLCEKKWVEDKRMV